MDEVKITDVYSGRVDRHKNAGNNEFSRETGFPSPARDHYEEPLSLDDYLIHRPAATFFVRVKGNSMQDAGIFSDDILVVDRSVKPVSGHIVVILLEGEHAVRRLERRGGNMYFCSGNADDDVPITDDLDHEIWGVVSYTIHKHI